MTRRIVSIGGVTIGGGEPIRVESMLSCRLDDFDGALRQVESLQSRGCELLRVAVPNKECLADLKKLNEASPVPLMGDIHFDPSLAEGAIEAGLPAVRLNPGNMGDASRLASVVALARERGVVIRVGANGGSLSSRQMSEAGGDRAVALARAVRSQVETLLKLGHVDIIVSAKSSHVQESLRANELLARDFGDFPFHIGITESGWGVGGTVKSACGIALLLQQGIGDTIRVSLSQSVEDEVDAAWAILRALDLRHRGGQLISCPTCGRRQLDTTQIVPQLDEVLAALPDGFTLAVMGCEVNGPREAAAADFGVAGAQGGLVLFRHGQVIARCARENLLETLRAHLDEMKGKPLR